MPYPINTFKQYYGNKYGQPVGKIALDAGLQCPNRKKGGCIYCSAESFTPFYLQKGDSIATQLKKGKNFLKKKGFVKHFAYFQQETTTAAPLTELIPQFSLALSDRDCIGLIISTRPDYVEEDLLAQLARIAEQAGDKEILFELGLQSAHDRTLDFLNRNHTYEDFVRAVGKIRGHGTIVLGVHLILGLPGEDLEDMLATVRRICDLGVDYIKFHHLQVVKDTRLHEIYEQKPFKTFQPLEYLEVLADILTYIPGEVVIHRLWSTAAPDLLVGPCWNLPSYKLNNTLLQIMRERSLYQGKRV